MYSSTIAGIGMLSGHLSQTLCPDISSPPLVAHMCTFRVSLGGGGIGPPLARVMPLLGNLR